MLSEGYITQAQYDQARSQPIDASYHTPEIAFSSPYLSEMVRQEMVSRYGEQAYEDGYRVYTTITRKNQQAAQQAVRNNVLDYDMRHGYRGPEKVLWKVGETPWDNQKIIDTLKKNPRLRTALSGGYHFGKPTGSRRATEQRNLGVAEYGRRPLGAALYLRYSTGRHAA
ncbi:multimodular transpeptidase-transglycosylase [Klebsiella oxytoca]|nr:multimodular transpeptidase-transglycosylase [Klebsiella oxytoca]